MHTIIVSMMCLSCFYQEGAKTIDGELFAQKLEQMPSLMRIDRLKKDDYSKIKTICEELSTASIEIIRAGLIKYSADSNRSGYDPYYFKPYVFNRFFFDIPTTELPIRGYFLQEGEEKYWKESWPWEAKDGSIVFGKVMQVRPLPHVKPKYTPVGDFDDLEKVYKKRKTK